MPDRKVPNQPFPANSEPIMEKRRMENDKTWEALQDSEKRYRRLFESAKDGILILEWQG